jgi:hypothetical protein
LTRWVPAASAGATLFFVLLATTLVVAMLVVRARTPDLVLEVTSITPRELAADRSEEARIGFFVREDDPRAEITIVDSDHRVVRTLAAGAALPAMREVVYRWDGHDDRGHPVREGSYRFRVHLPNRGRDMVWPRRIVVQRQRGERDRTAQEPGR